MQNQLQRQLEHGTADGFPRTIIAMLAIALLAFALGIIVGESGKSLPAMEQLAPHGAVHGRFGRL